MDSFGIDPLINNSMTTKIDTASSLSSRQKSCNACVRGKRRCDKRTPRCTRCAAKGLDCVYHKMPPSSSSSTTTTAQNSSCGGRTPQLTPGQSTTGSASPEMADVPDFDMGFDYESLGTETSPESLCHNVPDHLPLQQDHHRHHQHHHQQQQQQQHSSANPLHLGPGLDFDMVDFMNSAPPPPTTTTHDPTLGGAAATAANNNFFANLFESINADTTTASSKLDIPPVPYISTALVAQPPKTPVRDLSLLQRPLVCVGITDSLAVHDPRSWMGYTLAALKSMHDTFARTQALPFLHPRLWATRLPKPILDVFAAATAYAHRSPHNRAWIMKLLSDTAISVHRDGESADSPRDKLARVQALVILDSMRVFDGDVGLRAAAEREAHVLGAWIGELQQVVEALEAEAAAAAAAATVDQYVPSRERPPKSWDAWILLESARRTLMFSCAFVCINKLLKNIDVGQAMWQNLRFTASKHLWEAPSSVEFFRAWRDKPQYYIRDFEFKDFWSYARADDMDEFTKIMLMPQIGMDTLEHFMAGEDLSHVPAA
ncbi:hypothetical protein BB8028_0001g05250 [Beauveria bassiana]|uniref:Zn(2)-C6 fungal-type domain-containing protein n=1 Tax=Beauveria bassiana TaxID=176275 RepID=A0A2S7XX16_BEABA|nr:hypothetical protein BB8028_0001g05250 [Beauveria bassiana]